MTTDFTHYYLPALIGDEADYVVRFGDEDGNATTQTWMVPGTYASTKIERELRRLREKHNAGV